MQNQPQNNKRIAKNTLLLYFRMLFLLAISLYTSRVILSSLGVEDYGIYNVVGGITTMFTMISGCLGASVSRFITYELGKNDIQKLKRVFATSVNVQILLSVIFITLAETIGLWFLNTKLIIPTDRIYAANWVYQFSIITFSINLWSLPYNASIIAHEKMSAFAYISIVEAIGKLSVAYLIVLGPYDRLIVYALLLMFIAILVRLIYNVYCKKKFVECSYSFVWDRHMLKDMFVFAGWNFMGAISSVARDQGGNMIINIFYGPTVNAARGIAIQVSTAITGFVTNFQTALNPQITKNYAQGNIEYLNKLIFQGARLSFYMMLLLSLPVLLNTHYILLIWLKQVPEHTVLFIRCVLLFALSETLSETIKVAQNATGKVKEYQIVVGSLQFLNLPISLLILYLGGIPEFVTIVAIVMSHICLYARLYMLKKIIDINILLYLKNVYLNVILVSILSFVVPFLIVKNNQETLALFMFSTCVCIITTIISTLYVGCAKEERQFIFKIIRNKLLRQKIYGH